MDPVGHYGPPGQYPGHLIGRPWVIYFFHDDDLTMLCSFESQ